MESFIVILKEFGPYVALIAFFVWWSYQREKQLVTRLTKLEDFQKEKMTELTVGATLAIQESTTAIRKSTMVSEKLIETLSRRPCMEQESLIVREA